MSHACNTHIISICIYIYSIGTNVVDAKKAPIQVAAVLESVEPQNNPGHHPTRASSWVLQRDALCPQKPSDCAFAVLEKERGPINIKSLNSCLMEENLKKQHEAMLQWASMTIC